MIKQLRTTTRESQEFGKPRPTFRITRQAYDAIRASVGAEPAEQGGILGGSRRDSVVRHFYFDTTASRSRVTYSPDHVTVNRLFAENWNPSGIQFLGVVHSHPPGVRHPSGGDLIYARAILDHLAELDELLLPIVVSEPDSGKFELIPFRAVRGRNGISVEPMTLVVESDDTFNRVKRAYDLDRLAISRLIVVGVGGAAQFVEEMARAGVGSFVLIDPDIVSETNLATQQTYRKDIGRPKVDCVAARIRDINPNAQLTTRQQALDEIDDYEIQRLVARPLPNGLQPAMTLLCGFSDDFQAQARVNRLALHVGLPSLCAQVYKEGRGAEITFTYPGVTPACHRCVLSSRYAAYLNHGFRNDVTSDGTPIVATARLNALKGFLALALLHHETGVRAASEHRNDRPAEGPGNQRWGTLLDRIGNRNLIQIRMDPELVSTLGLGVFDRVFGPGDSQRILFDETVWLPQEPENSSTGHTPCPDCGGSGDLRKAIGTFSDTRIMPR